MIDRNVDGILEQANAAEKKGELSDAAGHISRYLRFRPNDIDAMERLAGLLQRSENSRRAWSGILSSLEHVLRLEPNRHEARRMAIETALKLRRFSDAETHLNVLFERQPELRRDPDLALAAARTADGLGTSREAASRYLALIDDNPSTVVAYDELVQLLTVKLSELPLRSAVFGTGRSWKNPELQQLFPKKRGETTTNDTVAALLDLMVREGRPTRQAYLARARFHSAQGELADAADDLKRAMDAGDGSPDSEIYSVAASVELAQARASSSVGRHEEAGRHRESARQYAERGLATASPDPKLHLLLAELSLERPTEGDHAKVLAEAERHLRDGLEQVAESRKALKPGEFEQAERLVGTEIQLRWSLTDFLMDRTMLAASERQKNELRKVADAELKALRDSGCRPELIDFLECRLLLQERRWPEAIAELEKTRVGLVAFPDLRKRVDLLLGETYRIVNNPDRRVETYRRALADDRTSLQWSYLLAKALADAGRVDEAIQQYKLVSHVPEAALEAARLTLLREWRKPHGERDLAAVDQFLASAERSESAAPGAALVRAQRSMAAGDVEAASASLAESSERFPDEISLWQASLALETQREDLELEQKIAKGEDLIRDAEARFADRVEIRLAKMEVARLRGIETLRSELTRQVATAETLSPEERVELLESLVRYAALTDEPKRVADLWRAVLKIQSDAVPAWLALASLAVETDDEAQLRTSLNAIRKIEGPSGPNGNFVEASWRLREVAADESLRADPKKLAEALSGPRESLRKAADQRPYWAALPRMLGMLESMAGNADQAFAYYDRAFRLGDRSSQTVRGLVDYHYKKRAYEAADAVFQQVERETPGGISGDLARAAAQVAFARKRVDAAIDWTKRAAGDDSGLQDGLAHAHLLFLKYRSLPDDEQKGDVGRKLLEDAQSLYRKAVDEAPQQSEAWFAYIVHFWRIGDAEAALAAIEEAKSKLPAEPAADRLISLAQYYEVVEMPAEAARNYRLAVEANPSDPRVRRVAADYFFRAGQLAEANVHLDHLLDPKNNAPEFAVTWARRGRALTTAAAGRYDDARRALGMLRGQSRKDEEAVEDLRAQLAVLSRHSTLQDRRDRIRILEQIQSRDTLSDAETLQLASLHSRTGGWPKARAIYEGLIEKDPGNVVFLSEFIGGALKNETADAKLAVQFGPLVERLRSAEPESIRTAVTTARFENAFSRSDAAAKALTDFAERMTAESSAEGEKVTSQERVQIRIAAEAAEELRLYSAADSLFSTVAEHAERPEDALVKASYLGRRGRYAEGLDVCERYAGEALPDAVAVTAVTVISTGPVPPEQLARAEELVLTAMEAEPNSTRIKAALAGLRSVQGRYDEAESIYRRVLAEQPENVAGLNNLAWLLAVTGRDPNEALRLVNEAIRISGPVSTLLDTRGTVEMSRRSVDKAIADLQAAYADTPTAYVAFHLAMAHDQAGDKDAARENLRTALKDGLSVNQVHATEMKPYAQLLDRLGITDAQRVGKL